MPASLRRVFLFSALIGLPMLVGCAATPASSGRTPAAAKTSETANYDVPAQVDIAKARANGNKQSFEWVALNDQAFVRARREKRLVLLHGAAEWCHWCHVMEATTYRDPRVGALLSKHFVAIRVDIDARPDIEERYDEWGWPATILLGADGGELGKFRGYMTADEMLWRLNQALAARHTEDVPEGPIEPTIAPSGLSWVGALAALRMDGYYDHKQGGWGSRQKAPIGENVSFELRRYAHIGDKRALARAVFSLKQQAQLIDPVWGGIYQYSAADHWGKAHFEKLMTYQAANLSAYAQAYAVTGDKLLLKHARAIERYLLDWLSDKSGAFYTTQDADVGAHDPAKPFIDGNVYYRLNDRQRRALGVPRIDKNIYAEENGLAIAALCDLYQATQDGAVLARARRAADVMLRTHVQPNGDVWHAAATDGDAAPSAGKLLHLADAAALGHAFARLAEVGDAPAAAHARRIADRMLHNFALNEAGALAAHTVEPRAQGVFAERRVPYFASVNAARLLAALHRLQGKPADLAAARSALAGYARPSAIRQRGRMIGAYLLALDEVNSLRWHDAEGGSDEGDSTR